MASALDAFELNPQATNRGLARRLLDQTLRPPEREYLAHVETIAALEDEGLKYPAIAETLGWPNEKLQCFARTDKFRLFRKYVQDRALLQGDTHAQDRRRAERRRWDSNAPKALDYFDTAFRRHTKDDDHKFPKFKKGDWVDPDRAERAAQLVARSAGWTEPVVATAKPKDLKVGVIQQAMHAIAAADRRETVVRITTTETIEVGQRETAALGGDA